MDRPATQRHWIRSPGYDLLFFSTLWMAPLALLVCHGLTSPGVGFVAVVWAFLALLRLPHVAASAKSVYARRSAWNLSRQQWILFLAMAILLVSMCLAGSLASGSLGRLLFAGVVVWGILHVGRQHQHLVHLYRRRAGLSLESEAAVLEKRLLDVLIIAGVFGCLAGFFSSGDPVRVFIDVGGICLNAAAGVLGVQYVVGIIRGRRTSVTSWPLCLYLLTAVAVMVRWPFYGRFSTPALQDGVFFLVLNGQHSLASLGVSFEADRDGRRALGSWWAGIRRFAVYLAPLAGVSLLLLWAITGAFTASGIGRLLLPATLTRTLALLNTVFVGHYYVEAVVWRMEMRADRVPSLAARSAADRVARAEVDDVPDAIHGVGAARRIIGRDRLRSHSAV